MPNCENIKALILTELKIYRFFDLLLQEQDLNFKFKFTTVKLLVEFKKTINFPQIKKVLKMYIY